MQGRNKQEHNLLAINEHSELVLNTTAVTQIVFQQPVNRNISSSIIRKL